MTLARSHECVVRAWPQKLEVWACNWTQCSSMRTCWRSASSSKTLHVRQNAIKWPNKIVTDARDVYGKVLTEKGGLTQQKGPDTGNRHDRRMVGHSGAEIRWTADEKMIMNGLTKDHTESRKHLARIMQEGEWSIQQDTAFIRGEPRSGPKRVRKTDPSRFL